MYSPSYYKEERPEFVLDLIRRNGFGALFTEERTSSVTHLPMILSGDILVSHMARANPHWKELQQTGRAKVLFQGPHAYISPAWYQPKADNVPTWNYAVVHVSGNFEIIEDPHEAFSAMQSLVSFFENKYGTGWSLPSDTRAIDGLMRGIVVFRLVNLEFEGKFKLSQLQDSVSRENVIAELESRSPELSSLMKDMRPSSSDRNL